MALRWYENNGEEPPAFAEHVIAESEIWWWVETADLDGDGDLDVISSGGSWFENLGGAPLQFVAHSLDGVGGYVVHAADLDHDGRIDVVGTGQFARNMGGSPPVFEACGLGPGVFATTPGDIDRDGDLDVATRDGPDVSWLEQPGCVADFTGDGVVDTRDFLAFLNAWNADHAGADINWDGTIDTRDVLAFLSLWAAGCS